MFALAVLTGIRVAALGLDFWGNILTAVVLAVAGYVFLWYALKSTDLSVLGPINAYKAVVGLLLAVVLIGEVPNLFGLIGVALIVAGSYLVIDRVPGQGRRSAFHQFTRKPGVQLRFAALICSATESIFLKRALLLSSPITTFLVWTVLCFAIAATAAVLLRRDVVTEVTRLMQLPCGGQRVADNLTAVVDRFRLAEEPGRLFFEVSAARSSCRRAAIPVPRSGTCPATARSDRC